MQDLFRKQPGGVSKRVGYRGGDVPNATYRNHGTHAEAIEIVFDPERTCYRRSQRLSDCLRDATELEEPASYADSGNGGDPFAPCACLRLARSRAPLGEMTFREIVELHPLPGSEFRDALLRCAEECLDCGASCTACADASLSESDLWELTGVIRVCLDCADVCEATARIATRQTRPDSRLVRAMIEACAAACVACAEECDRHAAHHEHCRICADVCRRCKAACDEVLAF